ncbi:MAG: M12 family metallo-peptidase [Aquabacterium sp.]
MAAWTAARATASTSSRPAQGVVGALRLGGRQIVFRQAADQRLQATADEAPVAGRAYALGERTEPGIYDIQGHFANLTDAREGIEITLPLPDGLSEVAVVTRAGLDEHGFVQVQGVSRMDGHGAPLVLTVGTDGVFGTLISQGREFQIVTRQGKTQLVDPQGAGWAHLRGDDQVELGDAAGADLRAQALLATGAALARAGTTTTTTGTTQPVPLPAGKVDTVITLLMSYSTTFVNLWGTETLARTRLSNIVETANAAYSNSGTGVQFRIVGWAQVKQADATPQVNLPALRAGSGAFSTLPALKKSTGAAISVFFAPFNTVTGASSTCGLAYIPGAGAAGLASFKSQAPGAMYAALNDGHSNGYYCETLSLGHELGHNLGNVHDKANSSFMGVFNYSYGKGVAGSFGTIMSYISPRVALFSSPQLKCGTTQVPCGTSTENVVATMLQTKSIVAALGNASAASVSATGASMVSGWLVNANGTPYTGAATVKASEAGVTCSTGTTGLYVCKVPTGVASVSVAVTAAGKVAAPAVGSFPVQRDANTPVNGTRFYLSDPPKAAAATSKK